MRYLPRAVLAGGIGFAVSCLAACGGGAGLLSGDQAGGLQHRLDRLRAAVTSHNCLDAASRAQALAAAVQNLPSTVDVTLKLNLLHGTATASQLAAQSCHQHKSTTTSTTSSSTSTSTPAPTTTTTPKTTTTTTSTPTTTTSPTTTSTTTTTTPTTPTVTQPSGGVGPGGGGGNGGGGGGGGGPPGAAQNG